MLYLLSMTGRTKRLFVSSLLIALLCLAAFPVFDAAAAPLSATSPSLGAAESYSVLGSTTVTNTGSTSVPGDLGVSPGSAITGFPPGMVGPPGTIHAADQHAANAQSANSTAFDDLDQTCTTIYPTGNQDLVGLTLVPGVYCADSFSLSGALNLSGSGVWIFKSSSTFITSSGANVVGGDPCDVWWRVASSATLGSGTSLIGNLLAFTSITLVSGASLDGRALAQTGAVTLDNNQIHGPPCASASPASPTTTATTSPTETATASPTETATALSATTATALSAATATALSAPTVTHSSTVTGTPEPAETHRPEPAETDRPSATRILTPAATNTPSLTTTETPSLTTTETPSQTTTETPSQTTTETPGPNWPTSLPPTGGTTPRREQLLLIAVLAVWAVGALALVIRWRER